MNVCTPSCSFTSWSVTAEVGAIGSGPAGGVTGLSCAVRLRSSGRSSADSASAVIRLLLWGRGRLLDLVCDPPGHRRPQEAKARARSDLHLKLVLPERPDRAADAADRDDVVADLKAFHQGPVLLHPP